VIKIHKELCDENNHCPILLGCSNKKSSKYRNGTYNSDNKELHIKPVVISFSKPALVSRFNQMAQNRVL
jgi:hypothetical protein